MNNAARATIDRMRRRGFRVLFMCNYDGSISASAISPKGEAFIVHGRLSDDSRIIEELARMVALGDVQQPTGSAASPLGHLGQ